MEKEYSVASFILCLLVLLSCSQVQDVKEPSPTFTLQKPGKTTSLFAEGYVSTSLYERDMAISNDQTEIIYTLGDHKQNRRCLVRILKGNNGWGKTEILNISGVYNDIEPFLSDKGTRLYFASNRPIYGDSTRSDYNIWYSDRNDVGWSTPTPLDSIINTKQNEYYPSLSSNGNLYFTATRTEGYGREDIFRSEYINGTYQKPAVLDTTINSKFYEFNAFISPDEDYLIFSSFRRPDGIGGGDLYISKKDSLGNWQTAKNLGEKINSTNLDYCPFVDIKSKVLYFTSERSIYLDEKFENIDDFRKRANGPENGFGDIYCIDFEDFLEE